MKMKWLFLILLLPAVSRADEVYLKGGGKVSGRIVARTATSVEVDVGAGKVTVPADRVERIEERRSPLDDYYDRAGRSPRRTPPAGSRSAAGPPTRVSRRRHARRTRGCWRCCPTIRRRTRRSAACRSAVAG